MGVYRNHDYQKPYFIHLSFPYLYFCLCFYCFFAPFRFQFNRSEFHDQMKLTWMKRFWGLLNSKLGFVSNFYVIVKRQRTKKIIKN